jgi:hypothetical protein
MLGHTQAGALGYNAHSANGLTALFIACGQDVANIVNSAVGITTVERTPDGDVYVSVTLPSLTVATVGGGTGFGTARECLAIMGCAGDGKALKLAEIAVEGRHLRVFETSDPNLLLVKEKKGPIHEDYAIEHWGSGRGKDIYRGADDNAASVAIT